MHFSPARGWRNDPNGLVRVDGEWHLFYQHHPFGDVWGDIGPALGIMRRLKSALDPRDTLNPGRFVGGI